MRAFTFGEEYGPFMCEADGCDGDFAYTCILTDEENERLPESHGSEAAQYILSTPLGTMLCEDCFCKWRQAQYE